MGVFIRCDLCGKDILPAAEDGDMGGGGAYLWGSRFIAEAFTVRRGLLNSRHGKNIISSRVIDVHNDCVSVLFQAKGNEV